MIAYSRSRFWFHSADRAAEDAAERQRAVEAARMALDEARGDHAAHRLAPGDRPAGLAEAPFEAVEQIDLVAERALHRPAVRGVGRARERVAAREQLVGDRAAAPGVGRRVRADRRPVAVAVEQQRPVPGRRHLRLVRRAVGGRPGDAGDRRVRAGRLRRRGGPGEAPRPRHRRDREPDQPPLHRPLAHRSPPRRRHPERTPVVKLPDIRLPEIDRLCAATVGACDSRPASPRASPTSSAAWTARCGARSARSSRRTGCPSRSTRCCRSCATAPGCRTRSSPAAATSRRSR